VVRGGKPVVSSEVEVGKELIDKAISLGQAS
jgi:hypothetical protein